MICRSADDPCRECRDRIGHGFQVVGGRKAGDRLARLEIMVAVLQPEDLDLVTGS
jgi:hypothetical protein